MASTHNSDTNPNRPPVNDEARFRSLFMECPVSLWEEDITKLVAYLDTLRSSGVKDVRAYLEQHPDEIVRCVGMIKILAVNKATLVLYEAPDEKSLFDGLSAVFTEESFAAFREILVALAEGRRVFDTEAVNCTLRGKRLQVNLKWSLLPDSGGTLNRSLVSVTDITDRKRAEDEIRSKEELFSTAFQSGPLLMTISDIDTGKYLQVNDNFVTVSGYRREEAIGKTSVELGWLAAEDRGHLIRELRDHGRVPGVELQLKRKNGETVWCLYFGEVITISGEKRLMSIAQDITDRKRAEEEARMLKHSIDVHYDGAYWMDSDNKFIYVNDAGCKALGYKREELIGETLYRVNPMATTGGMEEVWAWLRQDGSFSTESVHRRKDGSEFPVEIVTTYVRFGGKEYACGFARDITERKHAEKKLMESEGRYRTLVETADDAIILTDLQGNHLFANSAYYTSLGYAVGDDPNPDGFSNLHPDDAVLMKNRMSELINTGKLISEYRVRHKDSSWRYRSARSTLMRDDAGNPKMLLAISRDITEHKKTEEALQESEQKFRNLAEESPNMIFINKKGKVVFANKRCEDITGYSRDEFYATGFDFLGLIAPEHRDRVKKNFQKHLGGEDVPSYEYTVITKSGKRIESIITTKLIDFEGEKAILGIITNITERKKAEAALLESETRYRSLFEQSGDSILVMKIGKDDIPFIVDVNESALRVHGYSREEMVGRPISFLDPDTDIGIDDRKIKTLKKENFGIFTTQHRRKDGSLIDVEVRARLIRIGGEQVIVSTERDITERKRMEEALRKDEEFIRNILNTVDEAFIVIDRDYRIITANKAYCTSASCDDLIGKHCYEISHRRNIPCHDAGEECAVRTVFETGRPQVSVHTHQDEDGRLIYVETKAFPLKDSSGNVISAIETINNITEKHLLEEERLKTQKLEAIGTLAGGIAHDFNNLLQGVFGYISLAKLNADQKEKSVATLEQAEKALHLSVNLTSQLLTFSKGGKPVKQRTDLRPVIENAARFALSGSRSDHLLDISDDLWTADADSGQIGQVIQNIVLNADQAMPEGGHVDITAYNVQAPDKDLPQDLHNGRYVKISIKDNGIGIPEQYLSKIFDPYFTTKEKGSGLGLATSYSIVRNHNGLIDVRSLPGKGSTFAVYIPAAAPIKTIPVVAAAARPARRGSILVMDDDEVVRTVAGELVRTLGHEVDFAEHGEAAVLKFQTAREAGRPFDIVILDLTVRGGMGGLETVQKLRKLDPEVKAIVSSGYSDNASTAEYQKIGFRSFLKKPYNIEELRNTLNALLT